MIDRPGVWRRAGIGGAIAGIDLTEAMAVAPAELDHGLTKRLFVEAEAEFVAAFIAALPTDNPKTESK